MTNSQNNYGYDECISKGVCTMNPVLSSIHEVILVYLSELSFYILELETLGIKNQKIDSDLIDYFSAVISNADFEEHDLNNTISELYSDLYNSIEVYTQICKERNLQPNFIKNKIKFPKSFTITDAIKKGQKILNQKNEKFTPEQKNLFNIFLLILKSICIYYVELKDMNEDVQDTYKFLISGLSLFNFYQTSEQKLQEIIEKYCQIDHELLLKTYEARKKHFGEFQKVQLFLSQRKGKAILAGGTNLIEMQKMLEATRHKGIDVYTHGQMVVAHTLPELNKYEHLIGHYGKGHEYCVSDFPLFPGSIFLTKLAMGKLENIYRSKIFSTDKIPVNAKNIIKIHDYDFNPLINSALESEGFEEPTGSASTDYGILEEEFCQKIEEIANKIESGEIKYLITIGVSNKSEAQKAYFEEFFNLVEDDCFVISFSYKSPKSNIYFINMDYAFPLLYKALDILSKCNKKPIESILFTRCEPHTIPNLFYLKKMGANSIYFMGCSPNFANPSMMERVREGLGLKKYTTPQNDYRAIREGN